VWLLGKAKAQTPFFLFFFLAFVCVNCIKFVIVYFPETHRELLENPNNKKNVK